MNDKILSEDMTYYEMLNIKNNSSIEEIRLAFKQKALEYHPDRNPGNSFATANFILIKIHIFMHASHW